MERNLKELEGLLSTASEDYNKAYDAYREAQRKHDAAVQARDEVFNKYGVGNPSAQCMAEVALADQAIEKAKKEQEDAEQALRAAKTEAERRSRNVEIRKRLMRNSADKDTAYVVYQARIECTYGMRESYLSLKSTHGVMTREIPQMTVKDTRRNTNIINFGGCRSMENPSVERAAKRARNSANASIELKKDGRDTAAAVVKAARIAICPGKAIIEHFLSTFKKEEDELESLKKECIGECTACFPTNAAWEKGHEKVTINGEQVLLRRCTMRCNYGGRITILLSGQPE